MPPGGETFRLSPRFGENVLCYGSHEWLPYSKDEVHLKSSSNNLSVSFCTRISETPYFPIVAKKRLTFPKSMI